MFKHRSFFKDSIFVVDITLSFSIRPHSIARLADRITFVFYSTNEQSVLKPFNHILGQSSMKLHFTISLLALMFLCPNVWAQKQNPSFIYNNQIISYGITRYTPTWEIQPSSAVNSTPHVNSKLFSQNGSSEASALRSLMYAQGEEPQTIRGFSDVQLMDHWKRNRVRMYYRIKYRGCNVFLARLNDHSSRSIMPFKDVSGRWDLDVDFMQDPLFECLQDENFDPFVGRFIGNCSVNIPFDGIEDGHFIDYSGNDVNVPVKGIDIQTGRIGKCARFDHKSFLSIPADKEKATGRFYLDCHINIEESLRNEEEQQVFSSLIAGKGMLLTAKLKEQKVNLVLTMELEDGTKKITRFDVKPGIWFHFNITERNGHLNVSIDGHEETTCHTGASGHAITGQFKAGGPTSAKFKLDELSIGQ